MPSVGTVVSYPIPLYANVSIESDFYQPSRFVISNVTLGKTTTIDSLSDMDYVVGQLIRLIIPAPFGCFQLNGSQGYVLSVPSSTQVIVGIDSSRNVNSYIASSSTTVYPQILAIGSINNGSTNATGRTSNATYPPGAFINISPQ